MSEYQADKSEKTVDPSVDSVELLMVKDGSKLFAVIAIIAAVILGFVKDVTASWSVLLAAVIVILNLYFAAVVIRVFARISPAAIMAGALGSFIFRLAFIFLFALAVKNIKIFDFNVWLLAVAIGHVGLLAWETLRVSKTLASPSV